MKTDESRPDARPFRCAALATEGRLCFTFTPTRRHFRLNALRVPGTLLISVGVVMAVRPIPLMSYGDNGYPRCAAVIFHLNVVLLCGSSVVLKKIDIITDSVGDAFRSAMMMIAGEAGNPSSPAVERTQIHHKLPFVDFLATLFGGNRLFFARCNEFVYRTPDDAQVRARLFGRMSC